MANDFLTTAAAAAELGVSVRRVQKLITSGSLAAQRLGRDYLIRRGDLAAARQRRTKPGRPRADAGPF